MIIIRLALCVLLYRSTFPSPYSNSSFLTSLLKLLSTRPTFCPSTKAPVHSLWPSIHLHSLPSPASPIPPSFWNISPSSLLLPIHLNRKNAALHPLSPRPPSPPHYHPRPGHRNRHPPYPNHNRSSIQKHYQLHLPIRHCPAHPSHQQIHLDIDTNKDIRQGRPHRLSCPHSLRRPKRSPPQARGQRACQRLLDVLPVFCFELHTCCGKGKIS